MALSKCGPAWLPYQPQESLTACCPLGGCPRPGVTALCAALVHRRGRKRACAAPRLRGRRLQAVTSLTGRSLPPPRETLDFPRSWLLPVIRDHVRETRLGFFTAYFLPLATTLKRKGTVGPLQSWRDREGLLQHLSLRMCGSLPGPSGCLASARAPSSVGSKAWPGSPITGPCPETGRQGPLLPPRETSTHRYTHAELFPVQVLTAPTSLNGAPVKSGMVKPPMGHRLLSVKKDLMWEWTCVVHGELNQLYSDLSSATPQFGDVRQVYPPTLGLRLICEMRPVIEMV